MTNAEFGQQVGMFSRKINEDGPPQIGAHPPLPPPLQGSETVIFPCERWLAKSEDDSEIVRELVPSDIIIEKLSRDGNLKVTEVEVEDALESKFTAPTSPPYVNKRTLANNASDVVPQLTPTRCR